MRANPGRPAVFLLLAAVPFMRPFLFGERYSPIGIALTAAAAFVALGADRGVQRVRDRALVSAVIWPALLWLWVLTLLVIHATNPPLALEDVVRGVVGGPCVLAAALVVLRDRNRRDLFARWLVYLILAVCVSFVVTFVTWLGSGFSIPPLRYIPAGYESQTGVSATTPVFFPFTTTQASFPYFGFLIPRLLGLGREPGVMGALIAWCFFMVPRVEVRARRGCYFVLIAGLLGTQSTGGIGVFLAVLSVATFLIPPPRQLGTATGVARQGLGLLVLVGALYLAIAAPGLGVQSKEALNSSSVSDRQEATRNGFESALQYPLGNPGKDFSETTGVNVAGINIIAASRALGAVGFGISAVCLFRPLLMSPARSRAAPAVLSVAGTVLTAQPLLQSVGFFLLLLVAVGRLERDQSGHAENPVPGRPSRQTGAARRPPPDLAYPEGKGACPQRPGRSHRHVEPDRRSLNYHGH